MIYVVAGNYEQYRHWERFILPELDKEATILTQLGGAGDQPHIYLHDARSVLGRRFDKNQDITILYGTYYERNDWGEFHSALIQREFMPPPFREMSKLDVIKDQLGG